MLLALMQLGLFKTPGPRPVSLSLMLFVPERDDRIKFRGAANREIARQHRGHQQD
jgi:hypothetical protein